MGCSGECDRVLKNDLSDIQERGTELRDFLLLSLFYFLFGSHSVAEGVLYSILTVTYS